MNYLISYFLPHNSVEQMDIYEYKNRQIFVFIMIITILLIIPFDLVNFYLGKKIYALIDTLGVILLVLNIFYYKLYRNYKIAFSAQIITTTFILAGVHMVSKELQEVNLIWIPLLITASFYMAGRELGTKLSIAILAIMIAAEALPLLVEIQQENLTPQDVLLFSFMHLILAGVASIFLCSRIMRDEYDLYQCLNIKNEELKKAHHFNSTLLNTLAHDLSGPLTNIDQLVKMIVKVELGNVRSSLVAKIDKINYQTRRMFEIVNQARMFKSLDSGKKEIKIESVDLVEAINKSILATEEQATKKNISVSKNIKSPNHLIYAELNSLANNVLVNLLSNAIKFSNKDSTIDIAVVEAKGRVNLTIRDYGKGMPKELISKVFSPIEKTSRLGTDGETGTGFGMPIVKLFLDEYDADIKLDSHDEELFINHGTKVSIQFKGVA